MLCKIRNHSPLAALLSSSLRIISKFTILMSSNLPKNVSVVHTHHCSARNVSLFNYIITDDMIKVCRSASQQLNAPNSDVFTFTSALNSR
jgi:hypothetical protein